MTLYLINQYYRISLDWKGKNHFIFHQYQYVDTTLNNKILIFFSNEMHICRWEIKLIYVNIMIRIDNDYMDNTTMFYIIAKQIEYISAFPTSKTIKLAKMKTILLLVLLNHTP